MTQQYDFLQLTVTQTNSIVELDQGDNTVHATVHQLPDLIRALQRIHAEAQKDEATRFIEGMQRELRGVGKKRPLSPVKGSGPEGVA